MRIGGAGRLGVLEEGFASLRRHLARSLASLSVFCGHPACASRRRKWPWSARAALDPSSCAAFPLPGARFLGARPSGGHEVPRRQSPWEYSRKAVPLSSTASLALSPVFPFEATLENSRKALPPAGFISLAPSLAYRGHRVPRRTSPWSTRGRRAVLFLPCSGLPFLRCSSLETIPPTCTTTLVGALSA